MNENFIVKIETQNNSGFIFIDFIHQFLSVCSLHYPSNQIFFTDCTVQGTEVNSDISVNLFT